MLRVDGRFSGRIASTGGNLIVGSGGQVDANIEVSVATIHGIVTGDIIASDRIEDEKPTATTSGGWLPVIALPKCPGAANAAASRKRKSLTAKTTDALKNALPSAPF